MTNYSVLVLNQNYIPLNVCNVRRAIILVDKGRAEILQDGRGEIHRAMRAFTIPSVIRLIYIVKRPIPIRKLTRREVFVRDKYRCQYCGKESTKDLTLDHVLPRFRGGRHVWENVVSACTTCNHKKAGRTPREAGMKLMKDPKPPPLNPYYIFQPYAESHFEWKKFLFIPERS